MQQICWTNPLVAYPQYPIDFKWIIKFSENFYQYAMHCLYFQFMHCFEGHHVSTLGEITSNSGGHHVQVKKDEKLKWILNNLGGHLVQAKILIIYLFTILKTHNKHKEPVVITCKQRTSTCVLFYTFVTVLWHNLGDDHLVCSKIHSSAM